MAKREGRVSRKGLRWPKVTRDSIIFMTGLVLTINEGLKTNGSDRPYLLALYAGMMGLPVFLNQDEKRKKTDGETSSSTSLVSTILQKLSQAPAPVQSPPVVPDSTPPPVLTSPPQEPPSEEPPPTGGFT